jgi:mono/diheme cytochrome c family protein
MKSIHARLRSPGSPLESWAPMVVGLAALAATAQDSTPSAAPGAAAPPVVLAWDAMNKEYTARAGETTNLFTFSATNISRSVVYIGKLTPSCGCTVAKLPAEPWRLDAGSNGQVHITINFAGKYGLVTKFIRVDGWEEAGEGPTRQTNKLIQNLIIKVHLAEPPGVSATSSSVASTPSNASPSTLGMSADRARNLERSKVDRQAVFKGDCAACHAAPAHGKAGEELFQAVCAICHESAHRATMVPDLALAKPKTKRDEAYWASWIKVGKPNTLMPGFSGDPSIGGPLTADQIDALSAYLAKKYPSQSNAQN